MTHRSHQATNKPLVRAMLFTLGDKTKALAAILFRIAFDTIVPNGRILLAIDDTPTKRYGPKVEGAGLHDFNPSNRADVEYERRMDGLFMQFLGNDRFCPTQR